jgi:hypothetical protein
MNCLSNYIGLRGCGNTTSLSGLYINDLPGISLKQIVSLTNEEEATYLDMWNMIQRRSESRFSLDVREAMTKHYKLNSLMQGINLGNIIDGTIPAPAEKIGFTLELIESSDYEYVPSPFASIHIQQLNFYANGNANSQVFSINDISTGASLWSKSVNLVNGWNTIEVNQTFHNNYNVNSWRIGAFYLVTGDLGNPVSMDVPLEHSIPNCCDIRIRGAYSDDGFSDPTLTYTSNTYGLSAIFSVVCNWDALVCQNKSIFSRAYWYLLGIEMLTEQLYSSKINQYTTTNLQRAKELREEYQVEYMKSLEQISGGFKLSCDCCIECNEPIQLRESIQFY